MSADPPPLRYTFRHRQRLHGNRQFDAVFAARCRKNVGPISVLGQPNERQENRLGLVMPRRVGSAVKRQQIKRRLREAFRLGQHDGPRGYDIVVVVRPHETAAVADYQRMLATALRTIDLEWQRRHRRAALKPAPPPPPEAPPDAPREAPPKA